MTRADGKKLVWVTSATSFLGRHVARRLASDGFEVVGFARRQVDDEDARNWRFSGIEVGEFSPELLSRAIDRFGAPNVVFHAIGTGSVGQASTNVAADFERTFKSTEVLMDQLARSGSRVRMIYPSSAAVYGSGPIGPISERSAPNPVSPYGKTKLLTENMCRERAAQAGMELVVARFFSIYGAPQKKLLLWDLGRRLLSGQKTVTLGGTGDETRDFMHVTDAATHVLKLAQLPKVSGTFNIGTGLATSTRRIASALAQALDVNAEITFDGLSRPGDPLHQQADISLLSALSLFPLTPLRDGLLEYAAWLTKCGRP